MSEEEENLESLRMAALKTLKKPSKQTKSADFNCSPQNFPQNSEVRFNKKNKRGRFFGTSGRGTKTNQFHNRNRNPNLISITTVPSEEDNVTNEENKSPKLTLPQDRYSKVSEPEKSLDNSKFSRYDNSDKSESESENESEETSLGKLKKSDSLEDLMQQLDNEILGTSESKPIENAPKEETVKSEELKIVIEEKKQENEEKSESKEEKKEKESKSDLNVLEKQKDSPEVNNTKFSPNRRKNKPRSPNNRRGPPNRRKPKNFSPGNNFAPPNVAPYPLPPLFPPYEPIVPYGTIPQFVPYPPQNIIVNPAPPPPLFSFDNPFDRPLSIDTTLTATRAPLSPRSAAFVLENRAIIEKRKRSPRRSYSRSPSPKFRRSKSPRRSLSPRRRSVSPRRRSLSPRRSPPKTRKESPKPKPSVHERLGFRNNEKEQKEVIEDKSKVEPLDPVLEARKRKFENKEIKVKEGVIRLKPKEEEKNEQEEPKKSDLTEELNEDLLLEDDFIELETKVDEIFSDEDSNSGNEGRFKTKTDSKKVPVLPFTKLLNGSQAKAEIKPLESLDKEVRRRSGRGGRISDRKVRSRSRSPVARKEEVVEEKKKEEVPIKRRIVKSEKNKELPVLEKRFERKIEIKIKNPAKYEKGGKEKGEEKGVEGSVRKVQIGLKEEKVEEIVMEDLSEDEENSGGKEGDLRNQLSKKRAGRLHKFAPAEGVPRLLKNALQGAVFKKEPKNKDNISNNANTAVERLVSSDYFSSRIEFAVKPERKVHLFGRFACSSPDGKIPIHLRLGVAKNPDGFPEAKPRKKTRKRKNRSGSVEQV